MENIISLISIGIIGFVVIQRLSLYFDLYKQILAKLDQSMIRMDEHFIKVAERLVSINNQLNSIGKRLDYIDKFAYLISQDHKTPLKAQKAESDRLSNHLKPRLRIHIQKKLNFQIDSLN